MDKLTAAGYDYDAAQNRVKELIKYLAPHGRDLMAIKDILKELNMESRDVIVRFLKSLWREEQCVGDY